MRALLVITLLAACSETNPYYCENHPDNNCNLDADVNAPMGCTTSAQCTNGAKPVCDTAEKVCVACTADQIGSCAGNTPVCSTANTCIACTMHAQCSSNACLPSGACAEEPEVAYAAPTGSDGGGCTKQSPCKTIAAALLTGRPYLRLTGSFDEPVVVSNSVSILGEAGTTLRRTTTVGPVLQATGLAKVLLANVTIRDAVGSTGNGVYVAPGDAGVELTLDRVFVLNNAANGLNVQGGTLTMSRSVVSGNTLGGGIIAAIFHITNSLFVANGNGVSTTGGVTLTPAVTSVTFKFNTVANNFSSSGTAPVRGINCTVPMTASNTIVAGNAASGNCTLEYSLFDTGTPSGTNKVGNPGFKNIDAVDPRAPDYFHIQATSAAVDAADPVSTMATDIDGDARPAGNAPDIGADELN
jgi:hypothetical protein